MRRTLPLFVAIFTLTWSSVSHVGAWGFTGHKLIMGRAIGLLPPEIRPFFESYRTTIVEHAIDPDTYRTMGFLDEPPRHFLDMDAYGAFPFPALPHDKNEAVAKYGVEFVTKNGLLPWRAQEVADRLRDAFRQTTPFARDDIKLFSAVVTHYIGDAYQPFHAALNYDGQLTGQQGVHARFETDLVERYQDKLSLTPAAVTPVDNVREFTFAALSESFQQVDAILVSRPRRCDRPRGVRRRVLREVLCAGSADSREADFGGDHRRGLDHYQRMGASGKARLAGGRSAAAATTDCATAVAAQSIGGRRRPSLRSIPRSIGCRINRTASVTAPPMTAR